MSTSDYSARRSPLWLRDADRVRAIPAEVWITGALVVIAAAIRIIVLDNQSFWQDEALTAYEAQLPFGAMINTVVHVETTPPLYFVLIWAWAHIFGNGEVALRSVSLLAGVALVPISYLAGRDLVSRARRRRLRGARHVQPVPDLVLAGGARLHAARGAVRCVVPVLRPRARRPERPQSRLVGTVVVARGDDALLRGLSRRPRGVVAAVGRPIQAGGGRRRRGRARAGGDVPVCADRHWARRRVDRARAAKGPGRPGDIRVGREHPATAARP